MLLSQLVEINKKGSIASSVNFGMMDNPETNLRLCEGFIFNYDQKKPELSTVGILDVLRRSYHSPNEANIHLMIQDYGKGKSHFAVAIANFFKKPFQSDEVQGILDQVEVATANKNKGIAEGLKLYKQNQLHRHLVICLSGDKGGDIKKHFFQVLVKNLLEQGITDSPIQNTCSEPLQYLEGLSEHNRAKAEEYLQTIGHPDGDLNNMIRLLRDNNPDVIPTVKNLAHHITGFIPDFSANIDIEAILEHLVKNYCTGQNARFQGILIIFDELNYYLQSWSADQIGAGGTALQNITNICENHKGKIALLSFAQFHPAKALQISANTIQSYQKIATRLAPKNNTYDNPASSLELVLDNLLIQKEDSPSWTDFHTHWFNSLAREARIAYEQRIKIYKEKGWTQEEFYRYLGRGCFPLHPLTAYLLCNLDFTQDRTAIQFIKGHVAKFIQSEPVEKLGQLNYIYPIALVDSFIENFSNESVYTHYKKAVGLVAGSDDDDVDELIVIKALFLFYACGEKLTKSDREDHQDILTALTGLPKPKLKAALDKLEKTRDIIYYRPETKLYCFWEGVSPTNIEAEIEDKIKDKNTSINDVIIHCQLKSRTYFKGEKISATQFVKDNKLVSTDWQFEYKIYSIDKFIKAINSDQTLKEIKEKGILAYVLAETQEDLQEFRRTVDTYLSKSPIKHQIAVAIPCEETGDLASVLLKIKTLEHIDSSEQRIYGQAYSQLLQRFYEQVNKQLERLLKNCTFHCVELEKIPPNEQNQPQRVISALFQEVYPFVPPVDEIDKMRSDHATGSKVIGFACKQLFIDNLTPNTLPDQSYSTLIDTIFVSRWGLLKKTSQKYLVQEPTHEKIRAAWDKISEITSLEELPEKTISIEKIWKVLSAPPYGYSEYNFTILLAGWLAYYRKEVSLEGTIKLAKQKELIARKTQLLDIWGSPDTDILQKPTAFVNEWIIKGKAKLIRRKKPEMPVVNAWLINYDQAEEYLSKVEAFLGSNEPDPGEVAQVTKNKQLVTTCVEQIDDWFQPVVEMEKLSNDPPLEALLQLYPGLMKKLPAIPLRPEVVSVQPTQQQRDRMTQALQNINRQITEFIETIGKRSGLLSTEAACNSYKIEIQATIDQISPITSLSPHLVEILQNSLRVADLKLIEITEQVQVKNSLSEIQNLDRSLNDDSTQQDYIRIRAEVETLARSIPNSSQSFIEIQEIIKNLDCGFQELSQKIEIWQERSSGVTSRNQIVDLFQEINKQERLFTEESSKQRLTVLQDQLRQELLQIESRDETEKLITAELSTAQSKLQRIRDLSLNKLSEAFEIYQELINSSLPSDENTISLEEHQKKLEEYKVKGSKIITEKFAACYTNKLSRLEDRELIKAQLVNSQKILDKVADFTEAKANIKQAIENLDVQYEELRKQQEEQQNRVKDNQTIEEIRKYHSISKLKTIYSCKEANIEVSKLCERLNHPEQYQAEIKQIFQSIEEKLIAYCQSLSTIDNRLAKVDNLTDLSSISNEYVKLEFIFQDSVEYRDYQQLQPKIKCLKDDLEEIKDIETRYQQSNDINSCYDALEIIEQIKLQDLERFQEQIIKLEADLRKKIQSYNSQLQEFKYNLEHVTTVKDVQRLQVELMQKSSWYINSNVEEHYQVIKLETELLIELLRIVEPVNANTLELCNLQIHKLQTWQNTTDGLTENLCDRINYFIKELEQKKTYIIQQKQVDAQNWLTELNNQCTEMYTLMNDSDKFEVANTIFEKAKVEKADYIELLSPSSQQSLDYIVRQCTEELGKHKANQISLLFRQLPRLQRQSVHAMLAQYLNDDTED